MSALPVAQLIAVLALLLESTSGHVTFDSAAPMVNYGAYAETGCAVSAWDGYSCVGRQWIVKVGRLRIEDVLGSDERIARLTAENYIHELRHVVDGMDDGLVNGSPRPVTYPWTGHCGSNPAERYACDAVRTGVLR